MTITLLRGAPVRFGTHSPQRGESTTEHPLQAAISPIETPYTLDFDTDERETQLPSGDPPPYPFSPPDRADRSVIQSPQVEVFQQEAAPNTDTFSRQTARIGDIEMGELQAVAIPILEPLQAYEGVRQNPPQNFMDAAVKHWKALGIFSLLLSIASSAFTFAGTASAYRSSCNQPNPTPTPAPTTGRNPSFPPIPTQAPFPTLTPWPPIPTLQPIRPIPPDDGMTGPSSPSEQPGDSGNAGNASNNDGVAGNINGTQGGSSSGGDQTGKNSTIDHSEPHKPITQKPCGTPHGNDTDITRGKAESPEHRKKRHDGA